MRSVFGVAPFVLALALASPFAQAQDGEAPAEEDSEARMHFRVGRAYHDSGRFEEAAREFQAAYDLSGRPALLHNVFVAHRDAGNLPQAIVALREYLRLVPDAPEREQLTARLASMERLAQRDTPAESAGEGTATATVAVGTDGGSTSGSTTWWPGWVIGGIGAAAAIAGIFTGVAALDAQAELNATCSPNATCPTGFEEVRDRGALLAGVTDALILGGAAIAVVGTILALAVPSGDGGTTASLGCDETGCVGAVRTSF